MRERAWKSALGDLLTEMDLGLFRGLLEGLEGLHCLELNDEGGYHAAALALVLPTCLETQVWVDVHAEAATAGPVCHDGTGESLILNTCQARSS